MSKYNSIDLSEIVNLGDEWSGQDEPLAGSRVKQTIVHESGQHYIFKRPKPDREAQIWSELIASFIAGDLLGWPVQHAQIACHEGKIGNLLKYVFNPANQTLIPGEQLCKHLDSDFDPEVGNRHTWSLVQSICDDFLGIDSETGDRLHHASREYYRYWARTIAFDTLISNTDRHAENWSFLYHESNAEEDILNTPLMAPFYDNASSMGCEVDAVGLKRWFHPSGNINLASVEKYTRRGRHHLRREGKRFPFSELATLVIRENPVHRSEYEAIAALDLGKLEPIFDEIMSMDGIPDNAKMCRRRRAQVTQLLHAGQARIRSALEDTK